MWLVVLSFSIDTLPGRQQVSVLTTALYAYVFLIVFVPSGKDLQCLWVRVEVDHSASNLKPFSGSCISKMRFHLIVFQLK